MANRWKGNFVTSIQPTSTGTIFTGKANGSWGLNSQLQQKQANLWAKAVYPPAAPTSASALDGNTLAIVSFTAPSDTGGFPITSYTVTSSVGGITATGTSSPITVTGLTNGTSYTFTIKATSIAGDSVASLPTNAVIPSAAPAIGDAYGGGYYAGSISQTGDGVATHRLIISPKSSGELFAAWGPYGTNIGLSLFDGLANTNAMAALGASYEAATICKSLTIGGYNDWYLPSQYELEILYYFFKPTGDSNFANGVNGSNPYAVSPESANTPYTSTIPPQTSLANFIAGGSQSIQNNYSQLRSSTQGSNVNRVTGIVSLTTGEMKPNLGKPDTGYLRAIRKVAI